MKESLQRAFAYLQSQKVKQRGGRSEDGDAEAQERGRRAYRRLSDAGGSFVASIDMRRMSLFVPSSLTRPDFERQIEREALLSRPVHAHAVVVGLASRVAVSRE